MYESCLVIHFISKKMTACTINPFMFYTKENVINLETDYVNCSKIVKKTHWLNTHIFLGLEKMK